MVAADPRLARGLQAVADRRDRVYGEWTGRIGRRDELRVSDEALASATRLERFALCPFQYLLGNVLRVRAHEDPVEEEGITPRDRGSLVHQVLEQFFADALGRDPEQGWTDEDVARLHGILDEVGEAYRARGMTGRDLGWELESSAIRRWLAAVLDRDADERAARGARPAGVELLFGGESEHPAAEVGLPDGRRLRFKGAIDRVDRADDGSLLVIDYKTGKGLGYRAVDNDRLDRGQQAAAARSTPTPPVGPSPPTRTRRRRSRPTTGSSSRAGRRPGGAGRSTTRCRSGSRTWWPRSSRASRGATSRRTRARRRSAGRPTAASVTSTGCARAAGWTSGRACAGIRRCDRYVELAEGELP